MHIGKAFHFTDEDTAAQRGQTAGPRSTSFEESKIPGLLSVQDSCHSSQLPGEGAPQRVGHTGYLTGLPPGHC